MNAAANAPGHSAQDREELRVAIPNLMRGPVAAYPVNVAMRLLSRRRPP